MESINNKLPSEITSLNQNAIEHTTDINPKVNILLTLEKPCINNTPLVVNDNNDRLVKTGQGDGDTK
jgi:hypothetical protein